MANVLKKGVCKFHIDIYRLSITTVNVSCVPQLLLQTSLERIFFEKIP